MRRQIDKVIRRAFVDAGQVRERLQRRLEVVANQALAEQWNPDKPILAEQLAKRFKNRLEQRLVGPDDERLEAVGNVRQTHPKSAPADRRVFKKRPGGHESFVVVAHDERDGEHPAAPVIEPGEHPLGGEKRVR